MREVRGTRWSCWSGPDRERTPRGPLGCVARLLHARAQAIAASRGGKEEDGEDAADGASERGGGGSGGKPMSVTLLSRESRLQWGVNFMTGTPATAAQSKMVC